ncbi:MAG: urease accessory protein UreE [Oceanospirillaceae bacterium]|nr:urease accessory protein UreE [Oceanospirillaceae bacterium]
MLEVHQRIGVEHQGTVDATVVLDHEQRERGRLLLRSENDEEIRLFLKRGKALIVGEYLQAKCGRVIQIIGATEAVAQASCDDWPTFARACYHLGNRHVKIFVGDRQLHIKPDHVLEEMLLLMGLKIEHKQQVFIPESGAYQHAH